MKVGHSGENTKPWRFLSRDITGSDPMFKKEQWNERNNEPKVVCVGGHGKQSDRLRGKLIVQVICIKGLNQSGEHMGMGRREWFRETKVDLSQVGCGE